jgi:hypothetical protein
MSDRVRYHPRDLLNRLLDWCIAHASERPREVLAVGLAYVHGLNAHQMANLTVHSVAPVTIAYPEARRIGEIKTAPFKPLLLDTPDWLAAAAAIVTRGAADGAFVFRSPVSMRVPMKAEAISALVRRAGADATGCRVTAQTLNGSHVVALREAGTPLALHEIGRSPTWTARLITATPVLILPEPAT